MNYDRALEYIHSFSMFGSVLGLERLSALLGRMGDPQKNLRFVHVAGTNGKGSTSTMISNILIKSGYKTGLFISPYVLCFRERMQIDGEMISEQQLCECTEFVKSFVEVSSGDEPTITQFELETAIAFEWYKRQRCDIVCLEVGLGGRFDATNVIDCPLVQVITAIDFDHTAVLGDSLSKIAFEKAGIIKGGTVVIYPLQPQEALNVLVSRCKDTDSVPVIPDLTSLNITDNSWQVLKFDYCDINFKKKLPGLFQVYNAITAYQTAIELKKHGLDITDAAILKGIESTFFPARTEVISRKPLVILDGAHNLAGATALAETIKSLDCKNITIIIGLLADKEYEKVVALLMPLAVQTITLTPNNPRALEGHQLAKIAKKYCGSCISFDEYDIAIDTALANSTENDAVIVCGSLYLASDLRQLLIDKTR